MVEDSFCLMSLSRELTDLYLALMLFALFYLLTCFSGQKILTIHNRARVLVPFH